MYGNSVKSLKVKFIVSFILGIIMGIVMIVMNLKFHMSILGAFGLALVATILFPFEIMSFILNIKKIFLGIIKPIPILSFVIQYFIGLFMAFRAFVWLIKNWNNDTV